MSRMASPPRRLPPALGILAVSIFLSVLAGISTSEAEDTISGLLKQSQGGTLPPTFDKDVAQVEQEVDRIEEDALRQTSGTTLDREGQVRTLGKLLLFDKHLSVHENEACSFCHMPETGFTGPIQSLNLGTVAYPG